MNIYRYYNKPEYLNGYITATTTVPEIAYDYARKTKKPFLEGEKAIASNPWYAYQYAHDIMKGKFPEGEKIIASSPIYAYHYARYVIKGKFVEGENAINSDPYHKTKYKEFLNSL